jgi:hypothetical protein
MDGPGEMSGSSRALVTNPTILSSMISGLSDDSPLSKSMTGAVSSSEMSSVSGI